MNGHANRVIRFETKGKNKRGERVTKKEIKAWAGLSFWRDSEKMEGEALREKNMSRENLVHRGI